jgi:cytidylate kinase
MLIFISGSINSGKTTTARALADRLGAECINIDDLNDMIPNFNLATDLDRSMDLAIKTINEGLARGNDVVANYVVRQKDYDRFEKEINTNEQFVVILSPRLEVAQSKRGERTLSEWEVARVQHHYDSGIATPRFGYRIDNSNMSVTEVVDEIMRSVEKSKDSKRQR